MAYAGHLFCEADAGRGKEKMNGLPQIILFLGKNHGQIGQFGAKLG